MKTDTRPQIIIDSNLPKTRRVPVDPKTGDILFDVIRNMVELTKQGRHVEVRKIERGLRYTDIPCITIRNGAFRVNPYTWRKLMTEEQRTQYWMDGYEHPSEKKKRRKMKSHGPRKNPDIGIDTSPFTLEKIKEAVGLADKSLWMLDVGASSCSSINADGAISAVLATLPKRAAIAVALRFLDGMTMQAVGNLMGISPSAARLAVNRGIRMLRHPCRSEALSLLLEYVVLRESS